MSKYAVRNLRLCTKDCLCLYVCPTGASDTEDSIIRTLPDARVQRKLWNFRSPVLWTAMEDGA